MARTSHLPHFERAMQYTYGLCFMSQNEQKPKKGGVDTNMGNFVSFDTEIVDEDVPADGKDLGRGERLVMKYENGQHLLERAESEYEGW
jgi:protein kinase C substrate 80K-H